jgi:hypothetical protein
VQLPGSLFVNDNGNPPALFQAGWYPCLANTFRYHPQHEDQSYPRYDGLKAHPLLHQKHVHNLLFIPT